MAITADDVVVLNEYARGVMDRAHHHAQDVEAVCLAMLGGVVWRADEGSLRLKERDNKTVNVL